MMRRLSRNPGLTVWDDLKTQFGDDYDSLTTDAKRLKDQVDGNKWRIIVQKAEIGGRYKLAKQIVRHGGKGKVAEQDFDLHRDTASDYEHLYSALPWAYDDLMTAAAKSRGAGKDHNFPSIADIIALGEANKLKLGVSKTKPKYTGVGQVLLVNPKGATRNEFTDLPAGFPGRKSQIPFWEEVTVANMEKTARLGGGDGEGSRKSEEPSARSTRCGCRRPTASQGLQHTANGSSWLVLKRDEVLSIDDPAKAELLARIDFGARNRSPTACSTSIRRMALSFGLP